MSWGMERIVRSGGTLPEITKVTVDEGGPVVLDASCIFIEDRVQWHRAVLGYHEKSVAEPAPNK